MAGLFYMFVQLVIPHQPYLALPMVGASGGIYGLLLAYGLLFPDREMLFMMLFPLKAKQFVWLLAGIEFLTALFSGQGGLGAFAHLSGMGAGFVYLWLESKGFQLRKMNQQKARKKSSSHLRLVKGDEEDEKPPRTWH
jgi:membrane associated rhomboid family serine protease